MRDDTVKMAKLLEAFDLQQKVIEEQSTIIDRLYTLLSLHISAEELENLEVTRDMRALANKTAE